MTCKHLKIVPAAMSWGTGYYCDDCSQEFKPVTVIKPVEEGGMFHAGPNPNFDKMHYHAERSMKPPEKQRECEHQKEFHEDGWVPATMWKPRCHLCNPSDESEPAKKRECLDLEEMLPYQNCRSCREWFGKNETHKCAKKRVTGEWEPTKEMLEMKKQDEEDVAWMLKEHKKNCKRPGCCEAPPVTKEECVTKKQFEHLVWAVGHLNRVLNRATYEEVRDVLKLLEKDL